MGRKHKCRHKRKNKNNRYYASNYYKYLQSKSWKSRAKIFKENHPFCEICGSTEGLAIHHKHYNTLGCESKKDIMILCRGCHSNIHEGKVFGVVDPITREYLNLNL